MPLPAKTLAKILARFDELIAEGEEIRSSPKTLSEAGRKNEQYVDFGSFTRWRDMALSLFDHVLPAKSVHRSYLEEFGQRNNHIDYLVYGLAKLKALRSDIEHGFLDSLSSRIEGDIAGDYLTQAEQLMGEGIPGKYDHVPAAVLAGAVLERGLRKLCNDRTPPIPTKKPNGEWKTMNPLIEDLKAAGVFNELMAKHLRAWADIRNAAAHGRFEDFDRTKVETMLAGVQSFLIQHQ